jgi:hypothetical protein
MGAGSIARCSVTPTGPIDLVAKIQRDVIARGVFSSVKDLEKKLMRYIRLYNNASKTVKWKYFDPNRRIKLETVH